MLFSSQTERLNHRVGIERTVELMIDAGFPCIDVSMFSSNEFLFCDDWKAIARRLRQMADARGVIFNGHENEKMPSQTRWHFPYPYVIRRRQRPCRQPNQPARSRARG